MIKTVINIDSIPHVYEGQEILPTESYIIQPSEYIAWANCDELLQDISNEKVKINNGSNDIVGIANQINYLKDLNPIEVIPLTNKNDHTMQPWGALKAQFTASNQGCSITLSNASQDGLTFNYNEDCPITPRVGDYITQDNFCTRYWITSVDTNTRTIVMDSERVRPSTLSNGTAHYSKGYWISCDIPDWASPMYVWGVSVKLFHTNNHIGKNDFMELSIVDTNDFFKDNDFCNAVFGCNATDAIPYIQALGFEENGEYGHFTKYYDESNAVNIDDHTIMTPDGAPGELLPHFDCRISYFTSLTDNTVTEIFVDYFATAKI